MINIYYKKREKNIFFLNKIQSSKGVIKIRLFRIIFKIT